jgi:hypothetical protein
MDRFSARQQLQAQIGALRAARDASNDATERAAANEAIGALESRIDELLIEDLDDFAVKVNDAIADLDAVRTAYNLDAASAIGRVFDRLRNATAGAN